jgi:hypothetical protein
MDTWSIRKNEPKTNPNEPKTNPILANITPEQTHFKPKQSPFKANTNPNKPNFRAKNMLLPPEWVGKPGKRLFPVSQNGESRYNYRRGLNKREI